jgi:hypothetical protein
MCLLFPGNAQNSPDDFICSGQITENLVTPSRISLDKDGNIYVSDHNLKSILKYNQSGNLIRQITLDFNPVSIAVNNLNDVFVADNQTGTIYKIDKHNNKSVFYSGSVKPSYMLCDPENMLYVVDSELKQVMVLDISANVVKTIGNGTLIYPSSLAYDKLNQRILVGEHGGIGTGFTPPCKVWIFDLNGNLLGSFGSYGNEDGQFYRIQGITIGSCGNIYVCEPYQGNISVFNQNGSFITKFSEFGNDQGQLNVPLDIAFDAQERYLIGSSNNGSIQIFNLPDTLPTSMIFDSDTVICSGQSSTIKIKLKGTAPWSFTYTVNGSNPTIVNTDQNLYTIPVSQPGIYEIIELSDANYNGTCFSGAAVVKVTNEIPSASILQSYMEICEGSVAPVQIDLTGAAPWSFSYSIDGSISDTVCTTNNPYILNATHAGIYQINTLLGNACPGTELSGSLQLVVHNLPDAAFSEGDINQYRCENDSVELMIDHDGILPWGFTYMINERDTTSINDIAGNSYALFANQTGIYEIIQTRDENCTNQHSWDYRDVWEINRSLPEFSFDINDNVVSFTNQSTFAESYSWDFGDGSFSYEANPIHAYSSPGIYNVQLTASNNACQDSSIVHSVQVISTNLPIPGVEKEIEISPNPTSGILMINVNKEFPLYKIKVFNASGQTIYSGEYTNQISAINIDLSNQPNGMYFVLVSYDTKSFNYKVILNH